MDGNGNGKGNGKVKGKLSSDFILGYLSAEPER